MDAIIQLEYNTRLAPYRRFSDALRKAIVTGRLKPGEAVPSARELAAKLGLSRSTVLRGFEDLEHQGYVQSVSGRGTFVSHKLPGSFAYTNLKGQAVSPLCQPVPPIEYSAYGRRLQSSTADEIDQAALIDLLEVARPPINLLPIAQWRPALLRHCQLRDLSKLAYEVQPFGYPPLREALAAFCTRSRAVPCDAEQVVVFSGGQYRIDILGTILLDPGNRVAMEEPGYPVARNTLAAYGAEIVPVPVDQQGIDVDYLTSLARAPKLVYITPSHQDPTGAVLSLARRRQLLEWAGKSGAFILEDDYDCEYRYGGRPLPSVKSLDESGCVIYVASFWRTLFPVLRMGFLIVPRCLLKTLELAKRKVERDLPLIEQFALTDFINEGHLERHIRRTRQIYDRRRAALVQALRRHFGQRIAMPAESAGLHVLVQVRSSLGDDVVLELARAASLPLASTRAYYLGQARLGEFILAFAHLEEETIDGAVRLWAETLSARERRLHQV